MSYPRIFEKVFNTPWVITPAAHRAIQMALLSPRADERMPKEFTDWFGDKHKIEYFHTIGNVARIPLYGIIGKHLSTIETLCGGLDLMRAQHALEEAVKDDSIESIVLDISSPGGTVTGVPEFASMMLRAREKKPVYVYTEAQMCSGAQWIGAFGDQVVATTSAHLGSIGVYLAWFDETRKNQKEGVDLMLFEAGDHKAIGLRPPTEEEMEILQARVEETHADFKAAIRSQRGPIDDEWMQGQTISAEDAYEIGLIDDVVECFDDMLALIRG